MPNCVKSHHTNASGGGTVAAAIQLAKELLQDGKDRKKVINILAVVADTGERYMSTPLFEGIPTDMTEEEKELALSTPSQAPPAPGNIINYILHILFHPLSQRFHVSHEIRTS